jgi:hypothetical protein
VGTLYDDLVREAGEGGALDGDYSQVGHTHPLTDVGPAAAYTTTTPAAIPAGVNVIELNHATLAIEKTIGSLVDHQGLMVIKDTSATGTAAHKVTVTTGTLDGSHKVATLDAPNECLVVFIDSAGNGTVVANVGTVGLS